MFCNVVGARPNFMKMAPIILEMKRRGIPQIFVHTGQHYDEKMSKIFFEELGMPEPDIYLGVGSGTHATQTAKVLTAFEEVCMNNPIEMVLVAGDVNSTVACALTASKLHIPVAHVESGLRSFDRKMPEEINRVITDHISDYLFTTEPSGNDNLLKEGISQEKIYYVGNTMIDSLTKHLEKANADKPWLKYDFQQNEYGVVTLHRPSNVDIPETALEIAQALTEIATSLPLIFPIHPRTLNNNEELWTSMPNVHIVEPLGYVEFLGLMANAKIMITDSGGIQEETTALGVPCLTIRNNTERPITLTEGTNRLVSPIARKIVELFARPLNRNYVVPEKWDGKASIRIVDALAYFLSL